ncbi:class III lanthionine synthetase LanKC [Nocardiopsis metallicus]|uniref:non-specific serine/threonine protein kinase n=1 Tax=Nocardiopsis metallicus TaxID=179819 RepID=A0A840WP73_9ACTN|nr:class III lanthionine synthetase LanKC [Nocardiopsis metallicus]MBB5493536.1 hypothetical protein [Nocardiopsis metallicus]
MQDFRYLNFCPEGTHFYDKPAPESTTDDFRPPETPPAANWSAERGREWTMCTPPDADLPLQGWKIHVSATPENAAELLDAVLPYCVEHRLSFKYLNGPAVLSRRSSKYGDRTASGKFITIYPSDEDQLHRTLLDLDDRIGGSAGPYILSDLRWRSGPLYVRYGGFALRMARDKHGALVPGIEDPEGKLVPDERRPGFRPPSWVKLPEFLAEAVAARSSGTLRDFPYRAHKALHFSNGGGVYLARDNRNGEEVLLKEARPLAGLDTSGTDATQRMQQERWALEQLADLDSVPTLYDYRVGHEHHFLTREFVEGVPLNQAIFPRHPFMGGDNTAEERTAYTEWALGIIDQVEAGIAAMHARGVVFGDVHPGNVLVKEDGSIAFIDMETATPVEAGYRQSMGALGFYAPDHLRGPEVDLFGLACLRLSMFAPVPQVIPWGTGKIRELLDLAVGHFDLPDDFVGSVESGMGEHVLPAGEYTPVWPDDPFDPGLRARIASSVVDAATPDRQDRLYPGDAFQFLNQDGGVTFAYGAAGVLWALSETGQAVPVEHVSWLMERARQLAEVGPGFYTGLSGVAYTLERIGFRPEGEEFLESALTGPYDGVSGNLLEGLSGLGLTLTHFAEAGGAASGLARALDIADVITSRNGSGVKRPGLLHGRSGHALFLLRLYERTADAALLEAAVHEFQADFDTLVKANPDSGPRTTFPNGLAGGAGMAIVAHELLRHRADPRLESALNSLRSSTESQLVISNGLFNGRSGAVVALNHLNLGGVPVTRLHDHLSAFGWEAVSVEEGRVDFIGDHSHRLSTDLATGSAGVLLALDATARGRLNPLPFLQPGPAVSATSVERADRTAHRVLVPERNGHPA